METARLWADLGFWRDEPRSGGGGGRTFHIHGVTGPDEYTTVVNDNLFTNVMARYNLRFATRIVREMQRDAPEAYAALVERTGLDAAEADAWERAAEAIHIPFSEGLGIHPQDAMFLEREVWDLEGTPREQRPLLLHFHPLVIYRFQVLKQADVVLALFLQGNHFTAEQKLADFDYYDPLTTGDSTLSAVVQSIMAAEVGYQELAQEYFRQSIFVDLGDLHDLVAAGDGQVDGLRGLLADPLHGRAGQADQLLPRVVAGGVEPEQAAGDVRTVAVALQKAAPLEGREHPRGRGLREPAGLLQVGEGHRVVGADDRRDEVGCAVDGTGAVGRDGAGLAHECLLGGGFPAGSMMWNSGSTS